MLVQLEHLPVETFIWKKTSYKTTYDFVHASKIKGRKSSNTCLD